jgi:RecQ family ATP-dependent DNA helicase
MPLAAPDVLQRTLTEAFGFPAFRRGQEAVCSAVFQGQDGLVVMPTGSGKSLCYQLPAVARGGTALIISPLIALMEDQVSKLNGKGLCADRIHSGRNRESSRAAALAYRDGKLKFLFIAPERFSVPGFPDFLARRKPCLIAVDEAHCISQWGHDFRPDYRMLQRYLAMLRPAPILALTATATPMVQNDIVQQLGLLKPLRSIQGFRRKNIAIESVEIPPFARGEAVANILRDASRRPAIVYVPTRNESESLAIDLAGLFRTGPYHAGLTAERRQKIQEQFLAGDLDAIVATIAFGMGIDKPDIRTVIHTALPGSIEAYYQEIGRAGRDGAPSRAILMHSYADRHRHDFFFNRDYPDADILQGIYETLRDKPVAKDSLQKTAKLDADLFDTALEKLWIHGGAVIDPEENIVRGGEKWRSTYTSQSKHKSAQLDLMLRYAAADQCRMAALVRHFGDHSDSQALCGTCDFCAPDECIAQQFRNATVAENKTAMKIVAALKGGITRSTGRLHGEICPEGELNRDSFEEVLGAMARVGSIVLADAVFEKDGKEIPYRTARLTRAGVTVEPDKLLPLKLRESRHEERSRKSARSIDRKLKGRVVSDPASEPLIQALRSWRLAEAKSKAIPAFRIFSDNVLRNIADDRPLSEEDLLAIPGIGPSLTRRYGSEILNIVKAFE